MATFMKCWEDFPFQGSKSLFPQVCDIPVYGMRLTVIDDTH